MESSNLFYDQVDYKPDAAGMINNMDYGGLDLHYCIQELKDNCDDVDANDIAIYMLSDSTDASYLSQVIIIDNGPGMDRQKLANSIIMAKKSVHKSDDIGKFGMGLKNAAMAIGDKIVIITKTLDGDCRGLYMNLTQMSRDNTYRPTMISEGTDNFKALIARDSIYDKFMKQSSGVLISITDIKMNIDDIYIETKKLQSTLNLGYKLNKGSIRIYTSTDSEPLCVNEVDAFYKNNPENLEYCSETTLRVYLKSDKKSVGRTVEVLTGERYKGQHRGKSIFYNGKTKSIYLKHKLESYQTKSGKYNYKHKSTE